MPRKLKIWLPVKHFLEGHATRPSLSTAFLQSLAGFNLGLAPMPKHIETPCLNCPMDHQDLILKYMCI